MPFVRGAQQFVHECDAAFEPSQQLILRFLRDVFLRKIDIRFHVRESFQQVVAELIDALGKFAGELFVGGGKAEFRAGMNQIRHRFGLGEVDAAIKKCAPGKFAGLGQSRATGERGIEDHFRRQNSAMTGDFHNILARERARRAHHRDQNFIDGFSVADDVAELDGVRRGGRGSGGSFARRAKKCVGNRQALSRRKCG